jgi:hypothetical protein
MKLKHFVTVRVELCHRGLQTEVTINSGVVVMLHCYAVQRRAVHVLVDSDAMHIASRWTSDCTTPYSIVVYLLHCTNLTIS